jgi:maleate cis-trans isomerase
MSLPNGFPTHQLGFVSPLDLMDTQIYELYRIAEPNMIASFTSLGLTDFNEAAVEECLSANLQRCTSLLIGRGAELISMGATPIEIYQRPHWAQVFEELASETRYGGVGGIEAVTAAFRTLGVSKIAIANKWTDDLNRRLNAVLATAGIDVVATVTEVMAARDIKGSFAAGADLAERLALEAASHDVDAVWLAGGAWLTLPMIEDLECRTDKPLVTLLGALNWYCLNRVGCFEPRQGMGQLLTYKPVELQPPLISADAPSPRP